jgi:hypothetical protein
VNFNLVRPSAKSVEYIILSQPRLVKLYNRIDSDVFQARVAGSGRGNVERQLQHCTDRANFLTQDYSDFILNSTLHRAPTDKSGTADLATIDGVGRAPWFPSRRYYEGSIALKILTFEYRVAVLEGSAGAPLAEQPPP